MMRMIPVVGGLVVGAGRRLVLALAYNGGTQDAVYPWSEAGRRRGTSAI